MSFNATPAQVQPINGFGTAVPNSPALSPTSASSLIVVEITSQLATGNSVSVTDNIGNTYVMAALANPGTAQKHKEIWYCLSAAAGVTTVTVTPNATTGFNVAGSVSVWAGGAASLRAVSSLNNAGSGSPPSATVTPAVGDLVIGNMGYLAAVANTRQETLVAGYSLLQATQRGTTTMTSSAYLIATSTAATGPAWTMSPAVSTAEVTVAFAPAVASGVVLLTPVAAVGSGLMQVPGMTTTSSVSGGGPMTGSGLMLGPVLNVDVATTVTLAAVKGVGSGLMRPPAISTPGAAPLTFLVEADFANNGTWTDITTYVERASITRGRTVATNSVDPGKLELTLRNVDGRFTPGRAASPYYPNVKVNRPVRVSVFTGSRTYLVTARADSWVTSWEGGQLATCAFTGTDGFKGLARRTSQSLYAETVLNNPAFPNVAFYPLAEPVEATSFGDGNPVVGNPPALLVGSKYGAGTFTAGNGAGFLKGAPQATYCSFAPDGPDTPQGMSVIQFAGGAVKNGPVPAPSGPWTWGCWFRVPSAPAGVYTLLYARTGAVSDPSVPAQSAVAVLSVNSAGQVLFTVRDKQGTAVTATSAASYADGVWHYVTASLAADQQRATVRVDGASASATAGAALTPTVYSWFVAGGRLSPYGESAEALVGSLANVELYSAADTALSDSIRWLFGLAGFYLNNSTGAHIVNLAQNYGFAQYTAPFVVADNGLTTQMAVLDTAGQSYLSILQAIADTEQGVLFMDGFGSLVFRDRAYRVNQPSAFTLDNARGDVTADFQAGIDDQQLVNDFAVTRPGGAVVRVQDAASVADYGTYTNAPDDTGAQSVLAATDPELSDFAGYRVATYSQPQPRTPQVTVELTTNSGLWPVVAGVELGTRFTVTNLPAEAPAGTADFIAEQISWDYSDADGKWTLTLATSSPLDTTYPILTLDDDAYGLLDDDALFY